jgi:hypothetical protein
MVVCRRNGRGVFDNVLIYVLIVVNLTNYRDYRRILRRQTALQFIKKAALQLSIRVVRLCRLLANRAICAYSPKDVRLFSL